MGYSGFGLESRRRTGCGPQGLSDLAGESGPSTNGRRVRRQKKCKWEEMQVGVLKKETRIISQEKKLK